MKCDKCLKETFSTITVIFNGKQQKLCFICCQKNINSIDWKNGDKSYWKKLIKLNMSAQGRYIK